MWIGLNWNLRKLAHWLIFWLVCSPVAVYAISTVPSLMRCDDMIFVDGFVSESWPSQGSGGPVSTGVRSIYINSQLGNRSYYYHIPSNYQSIKALPIMFLFHGAAGAGQAPGAAQAVRNLWLATAEANDLIIVAQVATGTQNGSWVPANIEIILDKIMLDMSSRYNIEQRRIYAWGYSAGGQILNEMALTNAHEYAAYATSGATLYYASQQGVGPHSASRKIPLVLSVGQSDPRYSQVVSDYHSFQQSGWQAGYNVWFDSYVGGHDYFANEPAAVWNKLCISTHID